MRRLFLLSWSAVLAACFVVANVGACGGNDAATSTDAAGTESAPLLCDTFSGSGTACAPISAQVCFAECTTGGCKCVKGPSGAGVWACTVDQSCNVPPPDLDAGPGDDGSVVDTDSGTDAALEASGEGGDAGTSDAGDAGD